jgi:pyridinium-3,5-biscarboxylic acid mononucleotide sulfurtransferase
MTPSELVHIMPAGASHPIPLADDPRPWPEKLDRLRERLTALGSVVVAYSGGVDSSVLLRVAHEVLGEHSRGVIGRSDSYAERELELALEQAARFGARVETVVTGELADPNFRSNPANRCYHCKSELYRKLRSVAERIGARAVVDGTIRDDLGDWRPGRLAAAEGGVASPLVELGFTKADVRAVAAHFGLSSQDKPASPCLASRIPYGSEITRDKLQAIEGAENALRGLGFRELRVRHLGDTARIELPAGDLVRLADPALRGAVVSAVKGQGFLFVTLDLEGFRSGSLNAALRLGTPPPGGGRG